MLQKQLNILLLLSALFNPIRSFAINTLIFGGYEAALLQFPYQAAIFTTFENGLVNYCSGSLISNSFVLSSAHCFVRYG